jgi:23S rRNA (uracil1939-C5)-methyltransferase
VKDDHGLVPGQRLEVEVEKGVYKGLGLARHDGRVVFVPRGLPGDRLAVRVMSVSAGYVRAVPEALVRGAGERRESPCGVFPRCGGCAYQELDYPAQLRLKAGVLEESLRRSGVACPAVELRGSAERGWRARASFHLAWSGDVLRLGLHQEDSRRVVDVERCLQISDAMNVALRALRLALQESGLRGVHGIDLVESFDGGRLVATLVSSLEARAAPRLASLAAAAPRLSGFGVLVERGRFVLLRGGPYLEAVVLGIRLRHHARAFFQANRHLTEELAREVVALAGTGARVLDLYAGVGLFALPLAAGATQVEAVERSSVSVQDGRANASRAGLEHVRFHERDVLDALTAARAGDHDTVVLDPPRTGAGEDVVEAIARLRPARVIYVSCDPPTLGRDLKAFHARGYEMDAIRAFDMFPDTFHVETVVRLRPR